MMQSFPDNSYQGLLARVRQDLREHKTIEQLMDLLIAASEKALSDERIVLSRPEKRRLMKDSMNALLVDVLERIDGSRDA